MWYYAEKYAGIEKEEKWDAENVLALLQLEQRVKGELKKARRFT